MTERTTFVGLDVHRNTIAAAVADEHGVRSLGGLRNEPEAIRALMKRLGRPEALLVCYEAGPCGYVIERQLRSLGITCVVVAPALIPQRPGDQVKTDRRDALKLARLLRAGELTAVWAPDPAQEALRDLSRLRGKALEELNRVRHRISALLLRQGREAPASMKTSWTKKHVTWLRAVRFPYVEQNIVWGELLLAMDQAQGRVARVSAALEETAARSPYAALVRAYQCLRGVGLVTAVGLAAETGDPSRFPQARSLMGYGGFGVREYSSGERQRRGHLTKAGNSQVRYLAVEAAWHAYHAPAASKALAQRRAGQDPAILGIAQAAEERLHRRFLHLLRKGKTRTVAVVAVAREFLGFVWAMARAVKPLPSMVGVQAVA